jgi:hypothetical protein
MKRVDGTAGVLPIECVNPIKDKWRIRWDEQPAGDNSATYMEVEFDHKPTADEIKLVVMEWYNEQINQEILSGFKYDGSTVWLSSENQFNYKAQYDLAVQNKRKNLPVTFKFGTDEQPVYREFTTVSDLSDFYTKAMQHIQTVLADGWEQKDSFNVNLYQME